MASVKLEKIVEKMKLENLTPELDISKIKIKQPDINRPALQMAGYFEKIKSFHIRILYTSADYRFCRIYVHGGLTAGTSEGGLHQTSFL